MAPKRPTTIEVLPAASSSEESGGEEEEESSFEEEEETEQTQAPKPLTKEPDSAAKQSGSESETESDSDDEQPDNVPPAAVKPIVSKPMEEVPPKKLTPKPLVAALKSTPAKRACETDMGTERPKGSKRTKAEVNGVVDKPEETKKQALFQRRFSEDDEIAVLEGILEFKGKDGIDPWKDMNGFHKFVKKSLNCDVSVEQLKDKVRRLRRKFAKIVSKMGENKTFSKAHEQKAFDLSKEIWGSEATRAIEGGVCGEKSEEVRAKGHGGVREDCLSELLGAEGLGERTRGFMRNNVGLVDKEKLEELEVEWERLKKGEVELFLKRLDLVKKMVKMVMDAVNSQ